MNRILHTLLVLIVVGGPVAAQDDPFAVSVELDSKAQDGSSLVVSFKLEKKHYLYADMTSVSVEPPARLVPVKVPKPEQKFDKFTESARGVYTSDFLMAFRVEQAGTEPVKVKVEYQGCSDELCFLPSEELFTLSTAGEAMAPEAWQPAVDDTVSEWRELADAFTVVGRDAGYLNTKSFLCFLDLAEGADKDQPCWTSNRLQERSAWLWVLMILIGGLLLNLTPCILPMIPINIAIIGAGAQGGSRRRGFALGGTYGAAIALTYGALGLVVVLTEAKFGALNSTPWFNAAIAMVFVVLALAMFGVITIDLSRFQSKVQVGQQHKGHYWVALFMGTIAALLAGACVAPVVLVALTLATDLYVAGNGIGLLLPFVLGVGMGLPWPFAGAGLSFLPKPGKWMEWVKYAFGVLILGFAIYYGYQTYQVFGAPRIEEQDGWFTSLPEALAAADKEQKPLFIDFSASWCKNCKAMERTTLKELEVVNRLDSYVKLKFHAEKPNESATKEVLDYFDSVGLPTFVVMWPEGLEGIEE